MLYIGKNRYIEKTMLKDPINICAFILDKFIAYSYEKVKPEDLRLDGNVYRLTKNIGNKRNKTIHVENDVYRVYELRENGRYDISVFVLSGDGRRSTISFIGTNFDKEI